MRSDTLKRDAAAGGGAGPVAVRACAGVDGARGGWVYVLDRGGSLTSGLLPDVASLLRALPGDTLIAIDVPIGLPEAHPRAADSLARQELGPRRSSVFPAPARAALAATDYRDACDRSFARMGRKLSLQAYHLLPKIREVDAALRGDSALLARTFEVHPEVSFAAMNGCPLASPKRRSAGREERLALVRSLHPDPLALLPAGAVAKDDLLDAFAALWSAKRIAAGVARSLPNPIPHDAEGLPMAIWV